MRLTLICHATIMSWTRLIDFVISYKVQCTAFYLYKLRNEYLHVLLIFDNDSIYISISRNGLLKSREAS